MLAERLLILVVSVVVISLAVLATRLWARRHTTRLMSAAGGVLLEALDATSDGRPMLVTFSTPSCAACHTAQAPAVEHVQQQLGPSKLRVFKVDSASQPDVARAFGVLTVPSSVVLDPNGRVSAVNHGFAPSQKLLKQVQSA
jgi:thiol-disulfide isomerase/thioredoxin